MNLPNVKYVGLKWLQYMHVAVVAMYTINIQMVVLFMIGRGQGCVHIVCMYVSYSNNVHLFLNSEMIHVDAHYFWQYVIEA